MNIILIICLAGGPCEVRRSAKSRRPPKGGSEQGDPTKKKDSLRQCLSHFSVS